QTIAGCVETSADARPDLETLKVVTRRAALSLSRTAGSEIANVTRLARREGRPDYAMTFNGECDLVVGGLGGLLQETLRDEESGLWLSPKIGEESIGLSEDDYVVCYDANRGLAGIVFILSRLARFGFGAPLARARVQNAVQHLMKNRTLS